MGQRNRWRYPVVIVFEMIGMEEFDVLQEGDLKIWKFDDLEMCLLKESLHFSPK